MKLIQDLKILKSIVNKPDILVEEKYRVADEINDILLKKLISLLIDEDDEVLLNNGMDKGRVMLQQLIKKQHLAMQK